jgi:hypothetical protein
VTLFVIQVIVAVVVPPLAERLLIVAAVESLTSVTVALADFELSATLLAVIVIACPLGMVAGAV